MSARESRWPVVARAWLGVLLGLAAPRVADAQVVHVACGTEELQDVLDAAPPGAVVVADCGVAWGSIVIEKPVTLIGGSYEGSDVGSARAPYFVLAGPGAGEVVLVDVHAEARLSGPSHSAVAPGIVGGGFDALHVVDSHVRAAELRPLDGRAFGMPAISTSVPLIVVERSFVEGSRTDDSGLVHVPGSDGPPGIDAPGSTVLVLDSIVRGGASGYFTTAPLAGLLCADLCHHGAGGAGIVAESVYHSSSSLAGGAGARYDGFLYAGGPYGACPCTAPDGAPLEIARRAIALPPRLKMSGAPRLGAPLVFAYAAPGPAVLLGSFGLTPPRPIPGAGLLFLRPPQLAGPMLGAGTTTLDVPPLPALLGRTLAFQAFDPVLGLSRPVLGVVR